jgi:trimeric autotransporter adhesin
MNSVNSTLHCARRYKVILPLLILVLFVTTAFAPKGETIPAFKILSYKSVLPTFLKSKSVEDKNKTSLQDALNSDGTLKTGIEGSFDPKGFNMSYGANGEPVFTPIPFGAGDERWQSMPNLAQGVNGTVNAIAVTTANVVYVGGSFSNAGGVAVNNIAAWDGGSWSALGTGLNGTVNAIELSGSNVIVAGDFTTAGGSAANRIALWNGSAWSSLGTGLSGTVRALAVSGSNVYAGGFFTTAGGNAANNIALWNGTAWSALGTGVNSNVNAITSGPGGIYVGGNFTTAGGTSANRIALWNGSVWSALGSGLNNTVNTLAVSGSNVYVGGDFTVAGGVGVSFIAQWNGSVWSAMGTGFSDVVKTIAVGVSGVYAGGPFITINGTTVNRIAQWNGSSWAAIGSGIAGVNNTIAVNALDIGFTGEIYAAGNFTTTGTGASVNRVAAFKGGVWTPLGYGVNGIVNSVSVSGTNVYVGGSFTSIGGLAANNIARWNGTAWFALGSGLNGVVSAIGVSGSDVYAGGVFTTAGGNSANNIARWNGSSWSALGSGVSGGTFGTGVRAIAISNDNVYVGGFFTSAGGSSASRIARWNITNSSWNTLGTGVSGGTAPVVFAIAVNGGNVYAGGSFTTAGGNSANSIALWNGSVWSALGSGISGGSNPVVLAIAANGSAVYVGGNFTTAGGVSASHVALWNGSTWSALGVGVNNFIYTIALRGDNTVYVGGDFTTAGGMPANRIAVWNGISWVSLGTGLNGSVRCFAVSGTNLYTGGDFLSTGDGSLAASNIIQRNGVFPTATLQAAQTISNPTGVKLNGTVNSGNLTGNYYFEYGTSIGTLNLQTTSTSMSGSSDILVNSDVFAAAANTTYFYRLRVENAEGISYSAIQSYLFPSEIEVRQSATVLNTGSEYDFGNVNYLASSSSIPFTLYNLGLGDLNLTGGSAGNRIVKGGAHPADFTVVQSSIVSPVAYNTNQPFTVQFNPQAGGVRTATLTITSNDPNDSSYIINLKGTGIKLNQTITFGVLPVRVFGEAPFALTATASSGLPVSYSSGTPAVATISGSTVTLVGPGTTVITASQPGDGNFNAATNVQQTLTVRAAEPTAQPTALTFNNISSSSMNGAFTVATGSPAGYIVLRRESSAVADQPVDGTTYTAGSSTIGTSTVISIGSSPTFSSTGLNSGVTYHYAVFAYNGSGVTINYRQTSPLQNSQATIVSEPTAQASAISFSNLNPTSLTVSWTNGNGTERLVVARESSVVNIDPTDGIVYAGNTNFSTATDLGSGNKVVFRGPGNSVTVTNLIVNTVYHFRVYELNGSGAQTNYFVSTATNNPSSRTTLQTEPIAQPTALTFNNITVSSLGGSFTAAGGAPAGYLVLRRAGSAPTFAPADGTAYSPGAQGDAIVVSSAAGTTFTDGGLVAGNTYHYAIYSFNGTGQSINYRTASPLINNTITISSAPSASAATAVNQNSFTANWSAVTGAASYSLDVSSDNFSNLITGYAAKSVSGLNDAITGLTPGTTYQYRVRAVNASGLSTNSNTITQVTIPQTPATAAAQQILSTEFKALWNQSPGATGYQLDVSRDNSFNTFENNYQNRSISGASTTELVVTGLSPATQYFYRVRSVNAGGISPNSNVINVTTLSAAGALTVSNPSFTNSATATISITLGNGSGSRVVKFYSRGILENTFRAPVTLSSATNTYTTTLTPSLLDEMGIEFYFTAEDASTPTPIRSPEIGNSYVYTPVPANTNIPGLSFGGNIENYRIISIPYALNTNNTPIVFSSLGAYDKTKWRLLQLSGNAYADNPSTITPGKGYWFNARQQTTIELGEGTVVRNNQTTPFTMQLQQGWNMIATPFPFAIDWEDVRAANLNAQLAEYFVFNPATVGYSTSESLKPFEGGFVYVETATELTIPVLLKNSAGGRKQSTELFEKNLDALNWHLPITLRQNQTENSLGAVGMHQEARAGKDQFDRVVLPAFLNYVQLTTQHPDAHVPYFIRDVVPPQETYVWNLTAQASDKGPIELHWDIDAIKNNHAQLLLYDQTQGKLIDMRTMGTYTTADGNKIQIIYTKKEHADLISEVNKPYPNPFNTSVKLPAYFNAYGEHTHITLSILSLTGTEVYQLHTISTEKGLLQPQWSGTNNRGETLTPGLYLYKVTYSNSITTFSQQGKILKQ